MKSKFAFRCALLVILVNTIVSQNVSKFNITRFISTRKTGNETTKSNSDLNSSSVEQATSIHLKRIAEDVPQPDIQRNEICEDKEEPDKLFLTKLFKDVDAKFQSKLSVSGDILYGSVLTIFSILSFLGNSCAVVIFLFRQRKLSSAEVFFINLAIVDVLLSIASYPMSTAAAFRHQWDFGQIGCTIYGFICYFLGVSSICSVTSIALIRYVKTCDPIRGSRITCEMSCKMMAFGYLLAFLWAALPLVGFGSYEVEPYGLSCTLNWMAQNIASQIYIILVTIFLVFGPLVIIIFCYVQIIRIVRRSSEKMKVSCVNKQSTRRTDVQLTWISILITTGFVIAWSPYSVVCLYSSFSGKLLLPMWATALPTLFSKSAIILNPIIYIFFTERYRNDLTSLLRVWLGQTKKPKSKRLSY